MANQPKKYKKFVATAATATLVASAIVPVASAAHTDTKDHQFESYINEATKLGLFNDGGEFKPQGTLSRKHVALILGRYLEKAGFKPAADYDTNPAFSDLGTADAEYIRLASVVKEAGVFGGDGGKLNGANPITREQMAKVLDGLAKAAAGKTLVEAAADIEDVKVADLETAQAGYRAQIQALADFQITTVENYNPKGKVTRGQFAKFIMSTIDAIEKIKPAPIDPPKNEELEAAEKAVTDAAAALPVVADITVQTAADAKAKADAVTTAVEKASTLLAASSLSPEEKAAVQAKLDTASAAAKEVANKVAELTAPTTVAISSVDAIDATTVEVKFANALPTSTDFNNFELSGGLVVTDAVLSADRKTATLTTNLELTRNQEYTLTVTGFKNADGTDVADVKGKFTWEVAEGVVVALESTTLDQGQTIGLTVKDAAGKDVKDAEVTVRSYNTNIVQASSTTAVAPSALKLTAQSLAGTTDVEVITALPDGSQLINTFKVTVKEATTTVANKGYTLLNTSASLNYTHDNTTAFSKFGQANTTVTVGGTSNLIAFTETNGQPDDEHIDFTDATVKTSNGVVATAVVNGSNIEVTGNAKGTATLTVTLNDAAKTKKTFTVTVVEAPKFNEIAVNATSIKLSDETNAGAGVFEEGVNEQTVTVTSLNQFKTPYDFTSTPGKVTVTSSTQGLTLTGLDTDAVTGLQNLVDFSADNVFGKFGVQATKDTPITNAKVTVSYFEKATDTKPKATKVITVNVADIDAAAPTADLDLVTATEIDANAANTPALDLSAIQFTGTDNAYELDAKGNRIGLTDITTAQLATTSAANEFVGIDANGSLIFSLDGGTTDATDTILTTERNLAGTVNVEVDNGTVTKTIAVKYKNSAVIPAKATVATTPVSIKVPAGATDVTLENILFGAVDTTNANGELLEDTIGGATLAYGITKNAKKAGYLYNKPVVTITGTDGKVMPIGTGLYGLDFASEAGNSWSNGFLNSLNDLPFTAVDFDVELAVTNVVKTSGAAITQATPGVYSLADTVDLTAATDYATFTLIVKGIYVNDATITALTPAQKAKYNLLASPVQVNVNVSAE